VRKLRLIYVENDSVLRKMLSTELAKSPELELLETAASADEALEAAAIRQADAALIDFNLSPDGVNGVELGLLMRQFNENLGVIIYSQFPVSNLVQRVPERIRSGWSFFEKSASMELVDYVGVIRRAAAGKGNWSDVAAGKLRETGDDITRYFALSARQRNILMLTAEGKNTKEISAQLGITYEYARKELSRAYAILVPEAIPGGSLKAAAIAKYLQIMRLG